MFGSEETSTQKKSDLLNKIYVSLDMALKGTKKYADQIDQILRTETGIPYEYAFRNYASSSDTPASQKYLELSTVIHEQPVEMRKHWITYGLPNVQETYKKLTQLSFDSGEIDANEYQYLVGRCKRSDCLDKLCIEYKLLCCVNHPNSPNCKS